MNKVRTIVKDSSLLRAVGAKQTLAAFCDGLSVAAANDLAAAEKAAAKAQKKVFELQLIADGIAPSEILKHLTSDDGREWSDAERLEAFKVALVTYLDGLMG